MMKLYDLYQWIEDNNKLIDSIKVTSVKELYFNEMDGMNYQINVKFFTVDGYKDKLIRVHTNSSYLDDFEWSTYKELMDELANYLACSLS